MKIDNFKLTIFSAPILWYQCFKTRKNIICTQQLLFCEFYKLSFLLFVKNVVNFNIFQACVFLKFSELPMFPLQSLTLVIIFFYTRDIEHFSSVTNVAPLPGNFGNGPFKKNVGSGEAPNIQIHIGYVSSIFKAPPEPI